MKKILIVVKTLALGGVGSVIFAYYNSFITQGFSNIHMDFAAGNPIDERYKKIIEEGGSKLYITNKEGNPIKYVRQIAKIVREGNYEVVHIHGNSALITPDLLGAKLGGAKQRIAHSHNTTCNNPRLNSIMKPLFNILYTDAVACGEDAGKWMFGKKSFTVLKNGITLEQYKFNPAIREKVRKELGLNNDFLIGHVGNFNYQKNHELLIDLFARLYDKHPNAKLILVGDGETRNEIQEKVNNYNLQNSVIFYGVSNHVSELLMAMDCFVLPSRFEGLPCVLIEAQATGLPCVVSDKVSDQAKLSEKYIKVLKYDDLEEWDKSIELFEQAQTRLEVCVDNQECLARSGYDIVDSAKKLLELYNK